MRDRDRMPLVETLDVLRRARRGDDIVITSMGTAREWMALGDPHPLDIVLVPSAMGHATSLALGLALARPDRRVIACSGDGSLLMNLGSLASIVAAGASNLVVLVFDNGVYEVTGQQPTAAMLGDASRRGMDYAAMARACGFTAASRVADLAGWRVDARRMLDEPGPVFLALDVAPIPGASSPRSPGPAADRARRFQAALGAISASR